MVAIRRLCLSGCGWLFPFHVGVLSYLKAHHIVNTSTVLSGVSGGALVAAGEASGLTEEEMMSVAANIVHRLSVDGAAAGSGGNRSSNGSIRDVWGHMSPLVEAALTQGLPEDAHTKANGRISIAVTAVSNDESYFVPFLSCLPMSPKNIWREPMLFGESADLHFTSKKDLIQGCLASSHIPFYMDGQFSKTWRNQSWVDGGMRDILPTVPLMDQHSVMKSLPYDIMTLFRNDVDTIITPGRKEFKLLSELLPWTFAPSQNIDNLYRLRDVGYVSAERFIQRQQQQHGGE